MMTHRPDLNQYMCTYLVHKSLSLSLSLARSLESNAQHSFALNIQRKIGSIVCVWHSLESTCVVIECDRHQCA